MQKFEHLIVPSISVFAAIINSAANPGWPSIVFLIGAMSLYASCAILIKADSESKEVRLLKTRVEQFQTEFNALKMKIGFGK